jgi:hypothetical protein
VLATGAEAAADATGVKSPETYIGFNRAENFVSPGDAVRSEPHAYVFGGSPRLNECSLSGEWTIGGESAVLDQKDGSIVYRFHARDLHLVLGPASESGQRLTRDLPTLGICLGCQLMARALGAHVFAGPVEEIGWGSVKLSPEDQASCLAPLAYGADVLHWHGDTFDLPSGAVRLASTADYENQAFGYGKNGLGLQFHLEADPNQLEAWYVGHAVELAAAGISVPALRSATAAAAVGLRHRAESVFGQWLKEAVMPV